MDDLRRAIEAAHDARSTTAPDDPEFASEDRRPPPHRAPSSPRGLAVASVIAALLMGVWGWRGWTNPIEADPQAATWDAALMIETARIEIDEFVARTGHPPASLEEVGLDGLGVTYAVVDGGWDLSAQDGWGDVVGYRSRGGEE